MKIKQYLTMPFALVAILVIGCESASVRNLSTPDSLTLYSIDGRDHVPGTEPKTDEKFRGYPRSGISFFQWFCLNRSFFAVTC